MSQAPVEPSVNISPTNPQVPLPSRFPQTVVTTNRKEYLEPISLNIRNAQDEPATLPEDLQGHYFLVSPVGTPSSSRVSTNPGEEVVWVSKDGWTALYNGDGMVYRLSFDGGHANLKTRLMKAPCYYADVATSDPANSDDYRSLRFANLGISRAAINTLGIRNQLNTAFVPFKLPDEDSERLLVTWDVGRPYEIDPETLETLTPIGTNQNWQELLPTGQPLPFKNIMASAHPVYDPNTGEGFTINVGKSFWTMLALRRSVQSRLLESKQAVETIVENSILTQTIQSLLLMLYSGLLMLLNGTINLLHGAVKVIRVFRGGNDFVHLLGWDGKQVEIADTRQWNIVLPGNRPLQIDQTTHQMGITKDYIVFVETSFKFSLENTLPYQTNSLATSFKIFFTDFFNYPQHPYTKLYIVKRADLKSTTATPGKLPNITAQEVILAPEFSHYTVDYENPDGQIVLYVSHLAATDIAEYIRIYERSAYDDRDRDDDNDPYDDPELTARLHQLAGNIVSPMDISRLGRWVINGETGDIVHSQLFPDYEQDQQAINKQIKAYCKDPVNNPIDPKYLLTWSTAFYVCPDFRPTNQYTDIFWNSWGCWADTMTIRAIEAYQDYPERLVDIQNVVDLTYRGVPSSLCHLKIVTDEQQTKIELNEDNFYLFNNRTLGTSAQYVPRPNPKNQADGYIVCVVLTSDEFLAQGDDAHNDPQWSRNSEIWIFDAEKLKAGPLYKLSHPELNIGFSFHTTWMSEAKSPARRLSYDVKADYQDGVEALIKRQPQLANQIRQLFERDVYPHC